ncbi:hypothetical protein Avbf_06424 [Armadillidium vulgare]|nr:hypothetical protein Avbf_06424 [Armadillidium vulgare]
MTCQFLSHRFRSFLNHMIVYHALCFDEIKNILQRLTNYNQRKQDLLEEKYYMNRHSVNLVQHTTVWHEILLGFLPDNGILASCTSIRQSISLSFLWTSFNPFPICPGNQLVTSYDQNTTFILFSSLLAYCIPIIPHYLTHL